MDARPLVPDPQHDQHVAFPDETSSPPPESWWTPGAAQPPPPPPPPPLPRSPSRASGRRSGAWWAVGAVFLFGILMSGHDSELAGMGHGSAEAEGPAPSSVELVKEPVAPSGALEPTDVPLYGIPAGTMWFRLEVVGSDPTAAIEVVTGSGSLVDSSEAQLPYAGRLLRNDPDDPLTVTVRGRYGQKQVQCRVYLDDALVAIATGEGSATCEVPAWR